MATVATTIPVLTGPRILPRQVVVYTGMFLLNLPAPPLAPVDRLDQVLNLPARLS